VPGVTVRKVSDRTFLLHLGGKLEVAPKVRLKHRDDLSRAYTPGVARVCMAIAKNPDDARRLTIKRSTVAVVTDGSAVLGLGNSGPKAALPVMEGKAALFKQLAGLDAWPVCLDTQDCEEVIRTVKALAPVYDGVNLEDISAPRCFEIEARLREELDIPVFHDDQHGTAIIVLAALTNALRVVGKKLEDVRIVVSGVGAAGHAIVRLLDAQGAMRSTPQPSTPTSSGAGVVGSREPVHPLGAPASRARVGNCTAAVAPRASTGHCMRTGSPAGAGADPNPSSWPPTPS
jgi:malate dehydrogenase (oxaloacetate-decarboxylating)